MIRAAVLGLCLLATSLLAVEPVSRSPLGLAAAGYFFPSAANNQGEFGATFKTRLVLTNPSSSPIKILASLNTRDGSGGIQTIALAAGQTLVFGNFL